jgi:hypothetical protein
MKKNGVNYVIRRCEYGAFCTAGIQSLSTGKTLMESGANRPRAVAATMRETTAPTVDVFNNGFNPLAPEFSFKF